MRRAEKQSLKKRSPSKGKAPQVDLTFLQRRTGETEFAAISRQVQHLGATKLNKWEKKKVEADKLKEIRVKPPSSQKVPIKMLVAMRKKNEFRENRKNQRDADSGLTVKKKKKERKDTGPRGLKLNTGVTTTFPFCFNTASFLHRYLQRRCIDNAQK
jgi:hypothetical protein